MPLILDMISIRVTQSASPSLFSQTHAGAGLQS